MSEFLMLLRFLFSQFYGRYTKKDFFRMIIALVILVLLEITLLKQANIESAVLEKPYILGSLIAMNVYMTVLFVLSQWRSPFMTLICTLPVKSRHFWMAEIIFITVDTCLRRTLFFLILPVFLRVQHELSLSESAYWLGKFFILTLYSVLSGILLANQVYRSNWIRSGVHGVGLIGVGAASFFWPHFYVIVIVLHTVWILTVEYPEWLKPEFRKARFSHHLFLNKKFSFYRREWIRFLSSKPMVLNYVVLSMFSAFFCYNFVQIGVVETSGAWIALAALLLSGSPAALLYSIEKNNRLLLLALPIQKKQLFLQKYYFYAGLLLIAYMASAFALTFFLEKQSSFWVLLRGAEIILVGAALRLKSDEKKPITDWVTEQKMWNDSRKYFSYMYCLPILAVALLPVPFSNLAIIFIFIILFDMLDRKESGFFD